MFFALLGVAVIVVVLAGSAMSLFLGVPGARSGASSGADGPDPGEAEGSR